MRKSHLFISMFFIVFTFIANTLMAQNNVHRNDTKSFDPYWFINGNVGIGQFYGNISDKNPIEKIHLESRISTGIHIGRQLTPVWGIRGQLLYGKLNSLSGNKTAGLHMIVENLWEYNLNATANINNMFKYRPDRKLSVYGVAGIGFSNWESALYRRIDGKKIDGNGTAGNGPGKLTSETVIPLGLGVNYMLNDNWDINMENTWRYVNSDKLDSRVGGFDYDIYTSSVLGITYKFKSSSTNLKSMTKNYGLVKYTVTPSVLETKGDSIEITINAKFPEKYFNKKGVMTIQPVLKYDGGSYNLKPITCQGEKITGDGIIVKQKEGGSFTSKQVIPYNPNMNKAELVLVPVIYSTKENVSANTTLNEAKSKGKYFEMPEQKLADGVVYTCKRIIHDEDIALEEDHGYVKETLISEKGVLYFKVNLYAIDLKLPLNKNKEAKKKLKDFADFLKKGYTIKNIEVNAWASPEGEESYNVGLSEKRAKTGKKYMVDLFKQMEKDKNNPVKITNPEQLITFNLHSNGEDWNGFMQAIQQSNIKDKNIITNVVNRQSDLKKREKEIRNMTLVYREVEEQILPSLRRAEIVVNCIQPQKTDEQLLDQALKTPEQLTNEELLYAATLISDENSKLQIYKSTISVFPNNWKAYNNAAYFELKQGNTKDAQNHLDKANSLQPNNAKILLNLGVLAAKNNNVLQALAYYAKAETAGADVSYNKGILYIPKGEYTKALSMIKKRCNYNVGLAQLVSKDYSAATATLKCAPATAATFYLAAVNAARTDNTSLMYENLVKAIKGDSKYKAIAKDDREFFKYFSAPDFQNLVK
ncbi:MAG: outer membrane beta-barrel protein [Lentimicrobiaceae bacterium]|nr:outer membrane beta-barrel protein [Lentimicrobiaceae bacterium]